MSFVVLTCFERELILLLAIIVIESSHTNAFPSGGILLEWVSVSTIFIARVGSRLLVIGPLSWVGLVLLIAAHARETQYSWEDWRCWVRCKTKWATSEKMLPMQHKSALNVFTADLENMIHIHGRIERCKKRAMLWDDFHPLYQRTDYSKCSTVPFYLIEDKSKELTCSGHQGGPRDPC